MELTTKEKLLVFALGIYLQNLQRKINTQDLDISIQKSVFIDFVLKTKLFEKKERALYKNLENLEKKKLLSYPVRRIVLTERGWKAYDKISESLKPYLIIRDMLSTETIVRGTRKIQTIFR